MNLNINEFSDNFGKLSIDDSKQQFFVIFSDSRMLANELTSVELILVIFFVSNDIYLKYYLINKII